MVAITACEQTGGKPHKGNFMPRKKQAAADAAPETAAKEPAPQSTASRPAYIDGPPTTSDGQVIPASQEEQGPDNGQEKNWGPPYKAIFTSSAKGFEMGENRRFKQRVFKFQDKPDAETLAALKDNGFIYRAEEKAWTIHADAESRLLSDRLASQFAGQTLSMSR